MKTNIDYQQITEILKNFYQLTNLKTTIFSLDGKILADYPQTHCAFCHLINQSKEGMERCQKSNLKALNTCKRSRKTFVYRCHMDLVEVAFPLIKNEQVIGYAMFGQINNKKDYKNIEEKLLEFNNDISDDDIKALLTSINYHSNDRIKSAIKILEICATYIISEQMIEYNGNLYNKIIDYIDNTLLNQFTIQKMCNDLKVSRSLVYSTFAKYQSIGIAEYVRKKRIDRACELLESQKYSIKEIAYMTGFNDSNHFIKTFKKKYGITPKKYQQK